MGMHDEYCLRAQVTVLLLLGLYCTVWDRYMQVLYLGFVYAGIVFHVSSTR